MRLRDRSARALAAAVATTAALAAGACAGGSQTSTPAASLASTPAAAMAFAPIRDAWRTSARTPAETLRTQLEAFLAQYPKDGLAPLAHVYLAIASLRLEDYARADAELALGTSLPQGSTRDLWTVARARRLRLGGDPESAMTLLRPLVGKNVDPVTRTQFEEELTLTALATSGEYEAISYMDAWLRASTDEEKPETVSIVTGMVARLPKEVLVGALQAMRTQRTSFGYGVDIERILAARLVAIATTSGDAELARLLLDPDGGAVVVQGDAAAQLGELATSRRGLNVVEGRTIGLLLPTESPGLRDESADVLRGVMWAMGLPRGIRELGPPSTTAVPDAGARLPRPQCAALEPAPATGEPRLEDQIHLVTRDDAGSTDRTEVSLDELAGEGASLLIAGLDPATASRALRWGEARHLAVIALVPPDEAAARTFGFVLGEARADVIEALARAGSELATQGVAPVVDGSEVGSFPAQGGRAGPLTLLPVVSCEAPAARAGEPRFPVAAWAKQKTAAWLVTGSPACARDLSGELSAARARGLLALTLEAASLPPHAAGLRVVTAAAGIVPNSAASDTRDDELRRFQTTLGDVSWWTALGRDAATLARTAVVRLPTGSASETGEVGDRRVRARDGLAAARARLWTTEAAGWSPDRTMKRTICAVDAPLN
jgi:hypothetical protein